MMKQTRTCTSDSAFYMTENNVKKINEKAYLSVLIFVNERHENNYIVWSIIRCLYLRI
jgi:hypothetical protein